MRELLDSPTISLKPYFFPLIHKKKKNLLYLVISQFKYFKALAFSQFLKPNSRGIETVPYLNPTDLNFYFNLNNQYPVV